ncbi:MAG TPA: DUF3047 domain-containing protein [Burkholderiales bacterium]|nr:DUF3047 domain-containing protein [Burkholderiales bacterium]
MRRRASFGAAWVLLVVCAHAQSGDRIEVADFSRLAPGASLPAQWREVTVSRIPRHTRYTLVSDAGVTVLRAQADASMSSLAREVRVDPARTPFLLWRWKVQNLVEKSDPRKKQGDDFPARLYVFFDYDIGKLPLAQRMKIRLARAFYGEVPLAALCYVWATSEKLDTRLWNAYTDRVRVIVAQSGAARLGRWVEQERNVADDYREAFGEAPPAITGIALATDTDDTRSHATAFYGDVAFLSAPADER